MDLVFVLRWISLFEVSSWRRIQSTPIKRLHRTIPPAPFSGEPNVLQASPEDTLEVKMMIQRFVLATVVSVFSLGLAAVCHAEPSPLPTITLPPELARVLTDYEDAWQAKDEKALAALFAEDGFVLSGGRPPVRGRNQIENRYEGSGGLLALRALAYATEGAVGYIIGGYARSVGEPDIGKFTLTLRKGSDGRWLIMSDMDNGNQ